MTDCLYQLIKPGIQPAQVSAVPQMDFLPISLREPTADRTRQHYRAVTLLTVTLPSYSVSFSRRLSDSYQNNQAPSSFILIGPKQFIAALINGRGSELEAGLCSNFTPRHK